METPFFDKLIDMYEHYYCNGWLSDQEEEQYFEFKKIKKFIQIELPSDEEIENLVGDGMHDFYKGGFEEGAKWVIDKIKSKVV